MRYYFSLDLTVNVDKYDYIVTYKKSLLWNIKSNIDKITNKKLINSLLIVSVIYYIYILSHMPIPQK